METKTPAGHAESSAADLARLRAELQGTHRRIDDLTDRTERGFAAVHQHLEDIPSPWVQRVDAGDALLAQRIDDATTALTQRIDAGEAHLTQHIDAGDAHLAQRINDATAALTQHIDAGDAHLAQRIDDATAALTQRMEDHIHHTDRSFDGVNERFDVLTRRMETGFGQIRSFQWGLLTGIALLLLRTFVKL